MGSLSFNDSTDVDHWFGLPGPEYWTLSFHSWQADLQADRRLRPLARRALMIALPPRVAIRERKPCLLARFNRLGWKVRFIDLILSDVDLKSVYASLESEE